MRTDILQSLFRSYFIARKTKRDATSQLRFEINFEQEIFSLYDDIVNQIYAPLPSTCFIIEYPVKREIFAANFRDRVMHHFIYSFLMPLTEKEMLYDVYSCRVGKGALLGINRAYGMLQSCSENYTKDCYVLKLDISGYFMSINRHVLYDKAIALLQKNRLSIADVYDSLAYLIKVNIFHDPVKDCIFQSNSTKWANLPKGKSLFYTNHGCGLPIGNITSQLYSNLYLNDFDHWVKKKLSIKYYGRYVDDMFFMHSDKKHLIYVKEEVSEWLKINVGLTIHPDKTLLNSHSKGFPFLGCYILPNRRYAGKRIKTAIYKKKQGIKLDQLENKFYLSHLNSSFNSYLGLLKHHNTYNLRKKIIKDFSEKLSLSANQIVIKDNQYTNVKIV